LNIGANSFSYTDTLGRILVWSDSAGTKFYNQGYEYNAVNHYKNSSGEIVDIDPYDITTSTLPVSGLIPVTNLEYLVSFNDAQRKIRVLNKGVIDSVVNEFNRLIKG
jgi:hypothetical protein